MLCLAGGGAVRKKEKYKDAAVLTFSPNSWPENSLKFPGKFLIPLLSFKAYFKKDSVMGEHLSEHVSTTGIFHNNYFNITIFSTNELHVRNMKQALLTNFVRGTQLACTCSKLTIETLGQGMKYVQS